MILYGRSYALDYVTKNPVPSAKIRNLTTPAATEVFCDKLILQLPIATHCNFLICLSIQALRLLLLNSTHGVGGIHAAILVGKG